MSVIMSNQKKNETVNTKKKIKNKKIAVKTNQLIFISI